MSRCSCTVLYVLAAKKTVIKRMMITINRSYEQVSENTRLLYFLCRQSNYTTASQYYIGRRQIGLVASDTLLDLVPTLTHIGPHHIHVPCGPMWYLQGRLHHRKLGANAPKKFQGGGRFDVEPGGECFKFTKFCQLILRQIAEIAVTRWQNLRLKCTKFKIGWGSAPDPTGGA